MCNQQHVNTQLSFVVAQSHVTFQICSRVGHEQEVSEGCTSLAANPDRPKEHKVEVSDREAQERVDHEQHQVYKLEKGRYPRLF